MFARTEIRHFAYPPKRGPVSRGFGFWEVPLLHDKLKSSESTDRRSAYDILTESCSDEIRVSQMISNKIPSTLITTLLGHNSSHDDDLNLSLNLLLRLCKSPSVRILCQDPPVITRLINLFVTATHPIPTRLLSQQLVSTILKECPQILPPNFVPYLQSLITSDQLDLIASTLSLIDTLVSNPSICPLFIPLLPSLLHLEPSDTLFHILSTISSTCPSTRSEISKMTFVSTPTSSQFWQLMASLTIDIPFKISFANDHLEDVLAAMNSGTESLTYILLVLLNLVEITTVRLILINEDSILSFIATLHSSSDQLISKYSTELMNALKNCP